MSDKKGLIIYFDGPDGVGKTTQLKLVADSLRSDEHEVFETRAVGGTPIGELLRTALVSDTDRPPETDLYTALASQYALATDAIKRRNQGQIVLIDRSPLSIIGYQVFGDGLDTKKGHTAAQELLDLFQPDLIIVYTADTEQLNQRRTHRNDHISVDHFESKPLEYHRRVTEGFAEAAEHFKAEVVDGSAPIELVREATMQLIGAKLQA
jgi:dTMP kinase